MGDEEKNCDKDPGRRVRKLTAHAHSHRIPRWTYGWNEQGEYELCWKAFRLFAADGQTGRTTGDGSVLLSLLFSAFRRLAHAAAVPCFESRFGPYRELRYGQEIENENTVEDDRVTKQKTRERCDVSMPHCGTVSSIVPNERAHL